MNLFAFWAIIVLLIGFLLWALWVVSKRSTMDRTIGLADDPDMPSAWMEGIAWGLLLGAAMLIGTVGLYHVISYMWGLL